MMYYVLGRRCKFGGLKIHRGGRRIFRPKKERGHRPKTTTDLEDGLFGPLCCAHKDMAGSPFGSVPFRPPLEALFLLYFFL